MQTFAMIIAMLLFGGLSIWGAAGAAVMAWGVSAGFGGKWELFVVTLFIAISIGCGWLAVQVAPFTINVL